MASTTAWQALTGRRFLLTSWPWRALAYLAGGAVAGPVALLLLLPLFVVAAAGSVVLVGLPLLAALGLSGVPLAAFERWRLRLVDRR
ncbi:sensor domain-containing protein, partial [Spirillospora sp. NPDC049652]